MTGIAIYMEGGGNSANTKAELRQGMNFFLKLLKDAARDKSLRWKLVPCGGRQAAFDAFASPKHDFDYSIRVLLVDAEGPVNTGPRAHLAAREKWDLDDAVDKTVHLMIQTMETWIVADVSALTAYYGQYFHPNLIPQHQNLEQVAKSDVADALDRATRDTQKKTYQKIRHAGELLARINPARVKNRCPSCDRMFRDLGNLIAQQ